MTLCPLFGKIEAGEPISNKQDFYAGVYMANAALPQEPLKRAIERLVDLAADERFYAQNIKKHPERFAKLQDAYDLHIAEAVQYEADADQLRALLTEEK